MVYRPSEPVTFVRLIPVSLEVASTRAPTIGCPADPITRPMIMSVVAPTWARANPGSNAARSAAKTNELNRFFKVDSRYGRENCHRDTRPEVYPLYMPVL